MEGTDAPIGMFDERERLRGIDLYELVHVLYNGYCFCLIVATSMSHIGIHSCTYINAIAINFGCLIVSSRFVEKEPDENRNP